MCFTVFACFLVVSTIAINCVERLVPEMTCYCISQLVKLDVKLYSTIIIIIIIIVIKNEKIRVTLCENAAGALYIVNNSTIVFIESTAYTLLHLSQILVTMPEYNH